MSIDPITLEVLRNQFDVIAEEMEITLMRSSFSIIVTEAMDASSALFTADGQMIAQSAAIPVHLGCLVPTVGRILQSFPADSMVSGDAFIMNDPYDGGTHLPDTTVVQPVIYGGRTVALTATITHNHDIGGKTPGSQPTDVTEIYQEGICIPPLKLMDAGSPNETLLSLLRKNVRLPEDMMGDLYGQIAACTVGARRFCDVLDKHGEPTVMAAIEELMDRAEDMTRREIERIPDGSYEFCDYMDNDGISLDKPIPIRIRLDVNGSSLAMDFSGTGAQAEGPVNSVPYSTISAAYYVLRAITNPEIPGNSGGYRPLSFNIPQGSVLNPTHPAPVNHRIVSVVRASDAMFGALVQAVPERLIGGDSGQMLIVFGGSDPHDGQRYIVSWLGTGGGGARPGKDGIDVINFGVVNARNIPVESFELDAPVRVRKYRLRADSGGVGRHRGGLGAEKIFEAARGTVTVSFRGERFLTAPWGLHGGGAGARAKAWIVRQDGREEPILSMRVFTLAQGERLHVLTPGGGGVGDPLTRDPERVRLDVLQRKVSPMAARDSYGVVVDDEGRQVDLQETSALRETLRARRGPVTWTFDHGPYGHSEHGELDLPLAGRPPSDSTLRS